MVSTLAVACGRLLSGGTSCAAAALARHDETNKPSATLRIDRNSPKTKVKPSLYRQNPLVPVLFVGAVRHFVEADCVVSARSPCRTSGEIMTSRSMLLGSAALLFPVVALSARQTDVPALEA